MLVMYLGPGGSVTSDSLWHVSPRVGGWTSVIGPILKVVRTRTSFVSSVFIFFFHFPGSFLSFFTTGFFLQSCYKRAMLTITTLGRGCLGDSPGHLCDLKQVGAVAKVMQHRMLLPGGMAGTATPLTTASVMPAGDPGPGGDRRAAPFLWSYWLSAWCQGIAQH